MSKSEEARFYEVMKKAGLTAKWEAIAEARGEAQGRAIGEQAAWEKVSALLEQGYTADQLKRVVPAGIDKR